MALFNFFKNISSNLKNYEVYGPPKNYLFPLWSKLRDKSSNFKILVDNEGRFKIQSNINSILFTVDFIYFPNYIQVTISMNSIRNSAKVFNCPYDGEDIGKLVLSFLSLDDNKEPVKKNVVLEEEENTNYLSVGEHYVTIVSLTETNLSSDNWDDVTPQLRVGFKNYSGSLTHFFHLKGFMQAKDYPNGIAPIGVAFRNSENGNEEYAVDLESNERIESESKTEDYMNTLGEFAGACGLMEGSDITIKALLGTSVCIGVHLSMNGNTEYNYCKIID